MRIIYHSNRLPWQHTPYTKAKEPAELLAELEARYPQAREEQETMTAEASDIAGKLTTAQAELEELAAQSREAYQRWQELDRQVTAKADEIRELKRKIRLA